MKKLLAFICIILVGCLLYNKGMTVQDIYTIEQKEEIYTTYYHELSSKITDKTHYLFNVKYQDQYEYSEEIHANYSKSLFTNYDPNEKFEIRYDDQYIYLNTDVYNTKGEKEIRTAYNDTIKEILSPYEFDLKESLHSIEVEEVTKTDIISKDRYYFDQIKLKIHIMGKEYIVSDERYIDDDGEVKMHPSLRNLIRFSYQDEATSFDLVGDERNYPADVEEVEYIDVDTNTFVESLKTKIEIIHL